MPEIEIYSTTSYSDEMSAIEIADTITGIDDVETLIAFAQDVPLQRIVESLSEEQISSLLEMHGDDESFMTFVETKSAENINAAEEIEEDLLTQDMILQATDANTLIELISDRDLTDVAALLDQTQIDELIGKYRSEDVFTEFLGQHGISLPPVIAQPAVDQNEDGSYQSRFETEEDAIAFAEANGQGALTISENGTITNQYGEIMVYDSDGNLAPAPVSPETDIYREFDSGVLMAMEEVDSLLNYIGYFDLGAVAAALDSSEIDDILSRYSSNSDFRDYLGARGIDVPAPVYTPTVEQNDDGTWQSQHDSQEDAIEYAEANGQGELTVNDDGTITNQYGEIMVYDSDGNLAPAPATTDTETPTDTTDYSNIEPEPEVVYTPTVEQNDDGTWQSQHDSQEDAIEYAESNGQGELTVSDDGTITNQYGETMVYDSDGNLAPLPATPEATPEPGADISTTGLSNYALTSFDIF